ncbi:hypothetical protein SAMN02745133_02487 [Desulforamulus putei DSM 12395]|uniref:Uncharacterized protein n=1 Tax=Desulforamulus putei DSM 12395 TaxID=1121429 RepID=A0A1M5B5T8_9FIRM|nr:hypothetical protein SAMN02745133_02487 [Desulforamulus putei DSM 12395]
MSAAKYQLILAIEAAQNICTHLAARVFAKCKLMVVPLYYMINPCEKKKRKRDIFGWRMSFT